MAKAITMARIPLLIVVVPLLFLGGPLIRTVTAGLAAILISSNTLDGIIRKWPEQWQMFVPVWPELMMA